MGANLDIEGSHFTETGDIIGLWFWDSVYYSRPVYYTKPIAKLLPDIFFNRITNQFLNYNSEALKYIENGAYSDNVVQHTHIRILAKFGQYYFGHVFGSITNNVDTPGMQVAERYYWFTVNTLSNLRNKNYIPTTDVTIINSSITFSPVTLVEVENNASDNLSTHYYYLGVNNGTDLIIRLYTFGQDSDFTERVAFSVFNSYLGVYANVPWQTSAYKMTFNDVDITLNDTEKDGSYSEEQGGGGTYDGTSINIPIDSLPTLGAINGGFLTAYVPTTNQISDFSDWLWSTNLLDNLWVNPMDLIVGCNVSHRTPTGLGLQKEIKLGGRSSGVISKYIPNQYELVDFGEINVAEYYGNFLDYQGNVSIYLPYIGYKPIDINQFMNGKIHLYYKLDYATGNCLAQIVCVRNGSGGATALNSLMYQFSGVFYSGIPLTSQNANNIINGIVSTATSLGTTVATGGMTALGSINSAMSLLTSKKQFDHNNGLSANSGYLANQTPYLIFDRPIQSLSANFRKERGYMSNISANLSTLQGFTVIENIILDNISCTQNEADEIKTILKEGVIF